jgi:hypothetical protein
MIKAHYMQVWKCDKTHYYVKHFEFWKMSEYNLLLSISESQNECLNYINSKMWWISVNCGY